MEKLPHRTNVVQVTVKQISNCGENAIKQTCKLIGSLYINIWGRGVYIKIVSYDPDTTKKDCFSLI